MTASPSPSFDALRASSVADLQRIARETDAVRKRIVTADAHLAQARDRFGAARATLTQAQRASRDLDAQLEGLGAAFAQQRMWLTLVNEKLGLADDDPVPDPFTAGEDATPPEAAKPGGFGAFNRGGEGGSGEGGAG